MIKNKIKLFVFCICILCLSGCSTDTPETVDEVSGVSVSDSFTDGVTRLMDNYCQALKEHDYNKITECTTSEYEWNYNQTGFEEFSMYISDCSVEEIDFSHVQSDSNKFTVPVRYTIVYSDDYLSDNGSTGGSYSYYDDFTVEKNDDDIYRISASQHKGAG